MIAGPQACSKKNGVATDRAGFIGRANIRLCSSLELFCSWNHGNRVHETAKNIPREVDVHDHRGGSCRPVHEGAENMKCDRLIAQVRGYDMVAGMTIEEASDCMEASFRAQNLAKDVEDTVRIVSHVRHIDIQSRTRK